MLTLDVTQLNVKLILVIGIVTGSIVSAYNVGMYVNDVERDIDNQFITHKEDIDVINRKLDTILISVNSLPKTEGRLETLEDNQLAIIKDIGSLRHRVMENGWSKEDHKRFCETAELLNDGFKCGTIN